MYETCSTVNTWGAGAPFFARLQRSNADDRVLKFVLTPSGPVHVGRLPGLRPYERRRRHPPNVTVLSSRRLSTLFPFNLFRSGRRVASVPAAPFPFSVS